uniref:Alpha-ketoglutarate-dependent dioxygenase AlkB-like domain-containing protein n=1 Tax=Coccolithus braarudii TaxID=221442 RepID=A0A7S0LM18_9EUKA|mmetsp:Transcript_47741/g.101980  ORF Transcript_47741/g.101980 Transcript_47741/m.101980 type:complete len:164 (+) Transcript_47741:177-668(+)
MASGPASQGAPAGLALFTDLLEPAFIASLVAFAEDTLVRGRAGELAGKSYQVPPADWLARGQGRETVHFGVLVKCNKVLNAKVEPLPPIVLEMFSLLQEAGVFDAEQRPDTLCLNAYAPGSWVPPHVDSEAFDRPFCTLSLLSQHEVALGEMRASEELEEGGA